MIFDDHVDPTLRDMQRWIQRFRGESGLHDNRLLAKSDHMFSLAFSSICSHQGIKRSSRGQRMVYGSRFDFQVGDARYCSLSKRFTDNQDCDSFELARPEGPNPTRRAERTKTTLIGWYPRLPRHLVEHPWISDKAGRCWRRLVNL